MDPSGHEAGRARLCTVLCGWVRVVWEQSWAGTGAVAELLEALLGALGLLLSDLRVLLERLGALLEHLGASWGGLAAFRGEPWGHFKPLCKRERHVS